MLSASSLGMAEDEAELLIIAAIHDQVDMLRDMLHAEVHGNVSSVDPWGLTALHHAARNGSHQCLELLLQKDADPDKCSSAEDNCSTPLHHAAQIKSLRCMQLLLDYGANLDLLNVHGETAMDILRRQGNAQDCIECVHQFIERRRVAQEEAKREELYDFIDQGDLERAREILGTIENKEDAINRYYRGPNTLLCKMREMLGTIENKEDADKEITLLCKASYKGYSSIVNFLLDEGANGRPNGETGVTPLYAACYVGNLEVTQILVQRLPQLLMQPTRNDRSVPLHAAVLRGNIEIVKYLLSLRAKVEVDTRPEENPTSAEQNKEDTPKSNENRKSKRTPSRKGSDKNRDPVPKREKVTDYSILNVNILNADSRAPLHLAVICNKKDVVLELLNCKPIVKKTQESPHPSCLMIDIAGETGETPLHYAITSKNVEIARMLLLNGADPNRDDPNCLNPLQDACQSNSKELVKLLLDHGADANRFNPAKPEMSPLCIACMQNNIAIVKLLIEYGARDTSEVAREAAIKKGYDHLVEVLLDGGLYTEMENEVPENEHNLTPLRIIWSKRKLEMLKERWIINAVINRNKAEATLLKLNTELVFKLITIVDLSGNKLKTLPVRIFQLPSLRKLNLSDNALTILPCYETVLQAEESDAKKSDATRSDINKSDTNKLDPNKPDAKKSNAVKSDAKKSDAKKADANKSDAQKSDRNKSDKTKSDAKKSNENKSDANRSDTSNKKPSDKSPETADSHAKTNGHIGQNVGVKLRPKDHEKEPERESYQTSARISRPLSYAGVASEKSEESKNSPKDKRKSAYFESPQSGFSDRSDGTGPDLRKEQLKWNCPLLDELELQRNELTSLPSCVFDLPNLKVLNLCRNKLKELPLKMWTAPSLKDVLLQENELTCLPSYPQVTRKEHTSTSRPKPGVRKDEVDGRSATATASADQTNHMKSKRPSWDGESEESDEEEDSREKSGLLKLDFSDNKKIVALPEHLPCLAPNLSKLTAAGCGITGPVHIAQLPPGLTILDLSRNQIVKFDVTGSERIADRSCFRPSHVGLSKSESVPVHLNRPRPAAKKLCRHRSHRMLPRLKNLNLSQNNLEELSFMMSQKQNGRTELIDCVIPELQYLYLSNNALKRVPQHIGKVKKLLCFDISGNPKVDTLPPELGLCSQLYDLKFNSQQIRDPPRAIVDKKNAKGHLDVPYIRNFLKGVCEQSRPYPTIKLMMVGHSRKGKSTLLTQLRKEGTGAYQDQDYQQKFTDRMRDEPSSPRSKQDESTVGVDICDWSYQRRQFIGGAAGKEIKFNTWDFAGQEEYYATHACFLSRRAIYLLIWKLSDGSKGIDQLEGWLLNIQSRAADSAVIIVGTHYDELQSQNRRQNIERYRTKIYERYVSKEHGGAVRSLLEKGLPRVIAVTEVSSKTKAEYGIKELRNLIYEKVLSLRDTDDACLLEANVPASYLEVERAVLKIAKTLREERKYPVLDFKHFRTNVQEEIKSNGFRELENDELENAVKFLHDCGILLHFDGPALEDQYFVDPQWLCDMLANVITIRDVNPFIRNGVLKVDDLRNQIFRGQRFSSAHVMKYIELMNKFEVALQISKHYLLVPSLLPERQTDCPAISSKVCTDLRNAMNVQTYLKQKVFRRQYRIAYVPSGFWARLITRLIADNRISKTVSACSELINIENEAAEDKKKFKESLVRAAPPEWACWRTGVELSCFGVKLLRVCQLSANDLFYGHDGDANDEVFVGDMTYKSGRTPIIEILAPAVRLVIEVKTNPNDEVGFRVVTVKEDQPQTACELLALTVEHFDNLFTDWFPSFESPVLHCEKSIRRIGLCPGCLKDKLARTRQDILDEVFREEDQGASNQEPTAAAAAAGGTEQLRGTSGVRRGTKGSRNGGSDSQKEHHNVKRASSEGGRGSQQEKQVGKRKQNKKNSQRDSEDSTSEMGVEAKEVKVGQTEGEENLQSPRGSDRSESNASESSLGRDGSERGDGSETRSRSEQDTAPQEATGKDNANDDHAKGSQEDASAGGETGARGNQEEDGATSQETAQENGQENGRDSASGTNDPSMQEDALRCINGFEIVAAMKRLDANKDLRCAIHGNLEFRKIFPDLVFEDLPDGYVFQSDQITRGKFIAAGSYGAVFKGSLRHNDETVDIAIKVPGNTDAGGTRNKDAVLDAEKNKKMREGALTDYLGGVYTTVRQELSILVPVNHSHILRLIGVALSPRCLLIEFAPKGSLDVVLSDYKKAGRKLDPYSMQVCIIQAACALEYLHDQSIIYRDLKSENILVWSFPEPGATNSSSIFLKLADYGISRAVAITGVKGHLGTPGFIAPEIIKYRGKESYTKKVDSFSFGSFIYELISQELPFQENCSQADQLMADRKRPRLKSRDKRVPIPVLSLLYKCWEHDPDDRPSSADIHAYAKLTEFSRLFDDLECEDTFRLQCALTAFKGRTNTVIDCPDTKTVIGSELWLFSNDGRDLEKGEPRGNVTVLNYADGKCNILKKMQLTDIVLVACVVGSTVWIGTKSGFIKVFCSMTYKPLALGRASGSSSIISILHSPVCHCVLIGLTNDSIMSYNDNVSAYIHTIPQNEVAKHFGNTRYRDPIRELIANRVHPGNSVYNPIHCLAAVPSRARSSRIEDVVTYYGSGGEPLASSSREHTNAFDDYMKERKPEESPITYELWCGVDKGLINIFDLKELDKVDILAAPGGETNNPTLTNLSVKCIETRRNYRTSNSSNSPSNSPKTSRPCSVWVAIYPGTFVYRWNVDERTLEAKIDTLQYSSEHDLNSIKHPSRPRTLQAPQAQINTVLVVENELYIGTSFGFMIVCDSMSLEPLSIIRCFSERLDYLVPLQMTLNRGNTGRHREQLVLCSGRGCLDKWNRGQRSRPTDKNNCTILSWNVDRWAT